MIYFPDFCDLCLERFREGEDADDNFRKTIFKVKWRLLLLLLLLRKTIFKVRWRMLLLFRKTIFKLEDVVVVIVQEVNIQGGEEDR